MVVLAGPEAPTLGRFTMRALAPVAAIAMSAGRLPKVPPPLDPNEDAAMVAVGPHATLAVVIDGHLGFDTAGALVTSFKDQAETVVVRPVDDPLETLSDIVEDAHSASYKALVDVGSERARSGAALSAALVVDDRVYVTTIGDTLVMLTGQRGRPRAFRRTQTFLAQHQGRVRVESARIPPRGRLLMATDGLVDFTSEGQVAALLTGTVEQQARDAARAMLDAALMGGAGDNVTVLCLDVDNLQAAL
jgi:serine/threonine protein phosphatase PrpC